MGLVAVQVGAKSIPRIIPKTRMTFREARTVPSKAWVIGRRDPCRNTVHKSDGVKNDDFPGLSVGCRTLLSRYRLGASDICIMKQPEMAQEV
jgi:hypothetical protein